MASSSGSPSTPERPKAARRAMPATTGGSTRGTVTRARSSPRPRKSTLASSQASGRPSTRQTSIAAVEVSTERRSASRSGSERSCPHRPGRSVSATIATSGTSRTRTASAAGTNRPTGGRPRWSRLMACRTQPGATPPGPPQRSDSRSHARASSASPGLVERRDPVRRQVLVGAREGRSGARRRRPPWRRCCRPALRSASPLITLSRTARTSSSRLAGSAVMPLVRQQRHGDPTTGHFVRAADPGHLVRGLPDP